MNGEDIYRALSDVDPEMLDEAEKTIAAAAVKDAGKNTAGKKPEAPRKVRPLWQRGLALAGCVWIIVSAVFWMKDLFNAVQPAYAPASSTAVPILAAPEVIDLSEAVKESTFIFRGVCESLEFVDDSFPGNSFFRFNVLEVYRGERTVPSAVVGCTKGRLAAGTEYIILCAPVSDELAMQYRENMAAPGTAVTTAGESYFYCEAPADISRAITQCEVTEWIGKSPEEAIAILKDMLGS